METGKQIKIKVVENNIDQLTLGEAEGSWPQGDTVRNYIIGDCRDDGLGMVEWWPTAN